MALAVCVLRHCRQLSPAPLLLRRLLLRLRLTSPLLSVNAQIPHSRARGACDPAARAKRQHCRGRSCAAQAAAAGPHPWAVEAAEAGWQGAA